MIWSHILLLICLTLAVHGYKWVRLEKNGLYPAYVHTRNVQGRLPIIVCRYGDWAAGKDENFAGFCYLPYGGYEHKRYAPYDVLQEEPYKENLVYKAGLMSADDIRAKGVKWTRNGYICAVSYLGSGKLTLYDDGEIRCMIPYGGKEHYYNSGYEILTVQPATEYSISTVHYLFDSRKLLADKPIQLAEAILTNRDNASHEVTHAMSYSLTSTNSWSTNRGFTVGVSVKVTAGIPKIGLGAEIGVNVESSYNYQYGGSVAKTTSVSSSPKVNVPPRSQCTVKITAHEKVLEVPYTASVKTKFRDGSITSTSFKGVYKGVSVTQIRSEILPCVKLL